MGNNANIEIKESAINGLGVFALKDFRIGERVYSFKEGKIINFKEIKNLSEKDKTHLDKIGDDAFEIIESPGCYINHSCEPNIEERDRVGYALKDIKKGEELTIDYDKAAYIEKPFKCFCGSKNCRKLVRGRNF